MDTVQMDNNGRNNPLLHDLVLQTLFSYLDEKDIKSCRLVCLKWEAISRGYFAKLAKVFIKSSEYNGSEVLEAFKQIFPDVSLVPISKFHFRGFFPKNELEVFVNSLPNMTELILENFVLLGCDEYKYTMNDWKTMNLKALCIVGSHKSTKMIIPLSKISSIQKLYLDGSLAVLIDGQISPKEIFIDGGVAFLREGNRHQRSIHLNEFMDLKMLRKLISNQRRPTVVSADITDCQHLENLSSHWGGLTGLSPHLTIKELSISTPCDLSFLPPTIVKLQLGRDHVSCSSEVNLPNLRYLDTDNGTYLNKFINCPNLTDLVIGKHYNYRGQVRIPVRTSRMHFPAEENIYSSFLNNGNHSLDYLHLELYVDYLYCSARGIYKYSFKPAIKLLKKVKPKNLVITFKKGELLATSHSEPINELLYIIKLQSEREGTVAFGGILWDVDCPSLFEMVDRKATFYLHRGGHGMGIKEEEFKKMILLNSYDFF